MSEFPIGLLDATRHSVSVRLAADESGALVGHPVGISPWLLRLSFGGIAASLCGAAWYERDCLARQPTALLVSGALALASSMAMIFAVFAGAILGPLSRAMLAHSPFFRADPAGAWLELPCLGVRLGRADILGFAESRGWHSVDIPGEGPDHTWVAELAVRTADADGTERRLPVAAAERGDVIRRVGRQLADLYGVESRPRPR